MRTKLTIIIMAFGLLALYQSIAATSLSVGYQNPPGTTFGLNIMQFWGDWALEGGFGYIKSGNNDKSSSALLFSGDLDVKYLFLGGSFRPYLQAGTGWGFSTNVKQNSFHIGEKLFGGVGFFVLGAGVYTYVSYNTGLGYGFLQAGLGFDI